MNKKLINVLLAFCALIFFDACSKNEEVQGTQRINGAGDCIQCDGWSWSNGEASTTENSSEIVHSFSFKSTVSGELSFSHHMMSWSSGGYSGSLLQVSIGGKLYFEVRTGDGGTTTYSETSIGSVKAGEEIVFTGRRYYVKDIMIVGELGGNGDSPDDPNHHWDF